MTTLKPASGTIILLLVSTFCFSQTLRGKITDAKTGEPLLSASVSLQSGKEILGTRAGLDGSFVFKTLSPGDYTVQVQYIGYKPATSTVSLSGTNTSVLNFSLQSTAAALQEVQVTARRAGKESDEFARRTEKNAENVMNIISARTIQISPDITVGNVLQRVSGVSVERTTSGDGQYAIIRGMDKRYTYTAVDGLILPSPDAQNRSVPLDMFPADMVERLEVVKALTPRMEGNAIAGAMNLVMKEAPDHLNIHADLGGGFSQYFLTKSFSGFSHKSINFKSPIELYGNSYLAKVADFQTSQLNFNNVKIPLDAVGSVSVGNRILNNRLGFVLAGSYQRLYRGGSTLFYEASGQPGPDPANSPIYLYVHDRKYSTLENRTGLHGKFDYSFSPDHNLNLYLLFLQMDENQHRAEQQTGLGGVGEVIFRDRVIFNRRNLYTITLSGHDKLAGRLVADWSLAYAVAGSKTPDWVDFSAFKDTPTSTTQFVSSLPHIWTHSRDQDKSAFLNLTYKPTKDLEIIGGGMYRQKDRSSFYTDYSLSTIIPGQTRQVYTNVASVQYSFQPAYQASGDTTNGNTYSAKEDVAGAYIQAKYNWDRFQILGGVRAELTRQHYYSLLPPTQPGKFGTIKYTDILPSVHFKYSLTEKSNLRLSYFKGISRPNLYELIPGVISGDFYTESGNYNLKHATSDNLDFRFEHFFNAVDHVFAGVFYKNIVNPIEYAFVNISGTNYYYEPTNPTGNATNYGFELVFSKFVRSFGLSGNYSYTHSSIITSKAVYGRDGNGAITTTYRDETRPLQGQSNHIGNLSLLYKSANTGLDAQLSLVYTGRRLSIISPYYLLDVYQRGTTQLDFSAEKTLGKHFAVFIKVTNLLNNAIYQDVLHHNNLLGLQGQVDPNRLLVQKNIFNQSYLAGVRYHFFK